MSLVAILVGFIANTSMFFICMFSDIRPIWAYLSGGLVGAFWTGAFTFREIEKAKADKYGVVV